MKSLNQITIESYNNTVDQYIKNVDDLSPHKDIEKFISYIGENKKILDLGCGYGRDSFIFSEKGYDLVGVDLSEKMIEEAISRVKNGIFHVMDLRELDFEKKSFDGIWANASFLHIPQKDMGKALLGVFNILKPDGVFYISLKEGEGEEIKNDTRYYGCKKFWSFFQKEQIITILEKSGFTILDSYREDPQYEYSTNSWIKIFCKK